MMAENAVMGPCAFASAVKAFEPALTVSATDTKPAWINSAAADRLANFVSSTGTAKCITQLFAVMFKNSLKR